MCIAAITTNEAEHIVPAARASWPPLPCFNSTLWINVPTGKPGQRQSVARLDVRPYALARTLSPIDKALRRQNIC